jgi:hypothetical protein
VYPVAPVDRTSRRGDIERNITVFFGRRVARVDLTDG